MWHHVGNKNYSMKGIQVGDGHDIKTAEKLTLLQELYNNTSWLGKKVFSCHKGCATCCTQSVTMTSLEGELICSFMERKNDLAELVRLLALSDKKPQYSGMTTNQLARYCIEKHDYFMKGRTGLLNPVSS